MGAGSILHFIILSSKLIITVGYGSDALPASQPNSHHRGQPLYCLQPQGVTSSGGSSQECGCLSAFALSFVGTLTSDVPTQPGAPAPPGRTQGCVHISILV